MAKYSESELIGNKKKLTEIKKRFQVDKFNSVLNSPRKYPSGVINSSKHFDIFDVLEKVTKVDISFFDEYESCTILYIVFLIAGCQLHK